MANETNMYDIGEKSAYKRFMKYQQEHHANRSTILEVLLSHE